MYTLVDFSHYDFPPLLNILTFLSALVPLPMLLKAALMNREKKKQEDVELAKKQKQYQKNFRTDEDPTAPEKILYPTDINPKILKQQKLNVIPSKTGIATQMTSTTTLVFIIWKSEIKISLENRYWSTP